MNPSIPMLMFYLQVMSRVCLEAEACIDYPLLYNAICGSVPRPVSTEEAICAAAVATAEDVSAKLIIALTETGRTAELLAKYRAPQQSVVLSANNTVCRQLLLYRGLIPESVPSFHGTDTVLKNFMELAKGRGLVTEGDLVVVVHGISEDTPGGTNLLKVVPVP